MRAAGQRGRNLKATLSAYAGWLVLAALAAVVPPGVEPPACAVMAVAGLLAVAGRRLRPVAVLAAAAAAILDPAITPWVLAGALGQLALEARTTRRLGPPELTSELQRALMRARRRDADVAALVGVTGQPPDEDIDQVLDVLRISDSYEVAATDRAWELRVIFEDPDVDRSAVEQRLSEAEPGMRFGWAEFPADGATLETLLDHAREECERHPSAPALGAVE